MEEKLDEILDDLDESIMYGEGVKLDYYYSKADLKQAILELIREAENRPTHIMGKPIDEVIMILSGLELERIEDIKMTMTNLSEWMERVRADHHKAMQKAIDKSFENFSAQLKKEDK